MPFANEYAQHKPLMDFLNNASISEALNIMNRVNINLERPENKLIKKEVKPSKFTPKYVVSTDGSNIQTTLAEGYPVEELCAMGFATVTINMEKFQSLSKKYASDPKDLSSFFTTDTQHFLFPGSNIVLNGESSSIRSFSKSFFDYLSSCRPRQTGETLLETYEVLLSYKINTLDRKCPHRSCPNPEEKDESKFGQYKCKCDGKLDVYSTDALGLHEGMNTFGSNGDTYKKAMQVIERLYLINYIRSFEKLDPNSNFDLLDTIIEFAFIVDGPLAVYGEPGWLSQSISIELVRINKLVRAKTGQDILILGIEKTGEFVEHLNLLDKGKEGRSGQILPMTTMLLHDSYIQHNIKSSIDNYGQRNYFGRRFFHNTASGNLFVGSVPFYNDSQKNTNTAEIDQFPRLPDVLSLLETLKYSRYENGLVALSLAHSKASFPLDRSLKLLRSFFNKHLKNHSGIREN